MPTHVVVSYVKGATSTETQDADAVRILGFIRTGKLRASIERIRRVYRAELEKTGDRKAAKKAVAAAKKKLSGVLWSGRFSRRANDKLLCHSGLMCADLDELGERLDDVRSKLQMSPHLWALFLSPTGDGLKAVFRVAADGDKHLASLRAVERHVQEVCAVQIDESCKEVARLCFMSFDPDAYLNTAGVELPPIVEAAVMPLQASAAFIGPPEFETRRRIAIELLGPIEWHNETNGYCVCPGRHLHTNGNAPRDCEVLLDGVPTVHCFHNSCLGLVDGANHTLRSRIGKTEHVGRRDADDTGQDRSDDSDDSKKPGRVSAATRLVQFADEFAFLHDAQNRPFVRLNVSGHVEIWPVNSTQFRNLLAQEFYKRTGSAVNHNALADAIATLQGRALFASPEESVFLRVASNCENILIDLCDARWRVVEVTPGAWRVLDKSPVAFIRTRAMRPLPMPISDGSIMPLWDLLNVTPTQRPLVAGALLNYFHPHGPYFVTNFIGEQGSAKSCAARILRMLVDPNENPLRSPPREERDLLVHASNNWCVVLDNLSALPAWLSDGLCRLATGGGHSARQLYTDGEEFSLSVKRPVILNGIEDVAARPDLAERALQIELETIPDNRRKSEKDVWRTFEATRPGLFSAVLNGLVCALRELPNVQMNSLPRMADAALWATAGESAFGWKQGTFNVAYGKNLNEGAIASLDAHSVGVAIRKLLAEQTEWTGEPAGLLATINASASDELRRAQIWPKTPRALSVCLRRLAPAFRRAGIEAEFQKGQRRHIRLCNRGILKSFASLASPDAPDPDDGDAKDAKLQPMHGEIPSPSAELVEELV